ncbi:MAG: baseplate J/gp47 family protein [Ktedonobacteraceae bacterium]|nr:baseplate J/gp47 family protein [Ktedonobacteraceae bacterium]
MTEEQLIYLSPEEELTDVRERLEHVPARRIIFVVPPQTKLRSHVGWRLLHARARELGKDVLVVSPDRQVRVVVKEAGFKVADSLESPPSSKSRPTSRPGSRGKASQGARGGSRGAGGRQREQQGGPRPASGLSQELQPAQPYFTTHELPSSRQEADESIDEPVIEEDMITGGAPSRPSNRQPGTYPLQRQGHDYGPGFDYQINTTPSVPPVVPHGQQSVEEDSELDPLWEDIRRSRTIREAASRGGRRSAQLPQDRGASEVEPQLYSHGSSSFEQEEDPFQHIEDISPLHLREQRAGFVPIDVGGEGVPDIAEVPQNVLVDGEIEYLGDQDDVTLPADEPVWENRTARLPEEREEAPPSRVLGVPPRNTRSGKLIPSQEDFESEEGLPGFDEAPTRIIPPSSPAARKDRMEPAPLLTRAPLAAPAAQQRVTQSKPRQVAPPAQRPGSAPRTASGFASPPPARQKRRGLGRVLVPVLIVLFFVLLGLLVYIGPSADVTFALPAQKFSRPLALTASATSQQNAALHTIPAQVLVFDGSVPGQGTASGTAKVGVVKARGVVSFTNKGTQQLVIPTGTIIATQSGVQFQTTAEPLISPGSSYPVPVEALAAGVSGNVPANTITVIPQASLAKMQATAANVSATNPTPTSGGGVGNAAVVTQHDLDAEKTKLDPRAQAAFTAWLTQHLQPGDVQGKPIQQETASASPAPGQVAPDKTFTATLHLRATILVVRAADIQAAARTQLNTDAPKQRPNYALVPQQPIIIEKIKATPSRDGQSISLSFTATGQIAPLINEQEISTLLSDRFKNKSQALDDLNAYLAAHSGGRINTTRTSISIQPDFYPWMPLFTGHIHVHITTVPAP